MSQAGPLIFYSSLVGLLTGLAVSGLAYLINTLRSFLMGDLLGYLPPGLEAEGGFLQVFRGPMHWSLALLIPVFFVLSSYVGTGRGIGWFLAALRKGYPIQTGDYARTLVGSVLQLGAGSPLGREGPMGTLGLWIGATIGKRFPIGGARSYLPFAGLAAALAAAFHAPLAGALLASEMVFRGLALEVTALAPALIGALAGFTVYGAWFGYGPLLEFNTPTLGWTALGFSLVLGALTAGVGSLWVAGVDWLRSNTTRIPFPIRHGVFGILLAGALFVAPESLGDGLSWLQIGILPIFDVRFLAFLLLARFATLVVAGGVRGYGGYLTPSLALGGLLGLLAAEVAPAVSPSPEAAAIAGMCALLAGVARAPFAAVVLSAELGGYTLLPLVLPAAFVAYAFTNVDHDLEMDLSLADTPTPENSPTESAPQTSRPQPSPGEPG